MNFVPAIVNGFKNYVNFSGRACRSEFWFWTLFTGLGGLGTSLLGLAFSHAGEDGVSVPNLIFNLATLLPSIAVSVRRLHDVDRRGWWLLISLTVVGMLFPLLYWDCTKGTTGDNRFGRDPLAKG